jgi:hypothetical protein
MTKINIKPKIIITLYYKVKEGTFDAYTGLSFIKNLGLGSAYSGEAITFMTDETFKNFTDDKIEYIGHRTVPI